ncbi:MAG: hypothetical protein ACLFVP_02325 [Candidatus Bathyarchaeia archaeon]
MVGPYAEVPEGLNKTHIIMDTWLGHLAGLGYHVVGCPPYNDKMIVAIKKVCQIYD